MTRVLSLVCIALVIGLAGPAAAAKPALAILGLEAAPGPGGAVEPATTQVAKEITHELRQRAQGGASPYVIAPNSAKELTEEKLLMSCDNEAPSCMAVIGAGLAANYLLYGRVEKRAGVYRVTLKLLDVQSKKVQSGVEDMPLGGVPANVSRRLYHKLIGDAPVVGSLNVKATSQTGSPVSTGKVMIDDEPRGSLSSGRLTVTGIAEGRHVIAIEAGGYRRFEETVIVHGGEQATLSALLLEQKGGGSRSLSSPRSVLWKVTLGVSLAVSVAGAGSALYSYEQRNQSIDDMMTAPINPSMDSTSVTPGDCDKTAGQLATSHNVMFNPAAFDSACSWHKRIYLSYAVGGVGLLGAVASLILMSRDTGPTEGLATAPRSRKREIAITPIVSPHSTGASFSLRW